MNRPTDHDQNSLRNFLENDNPPLVNGDSDFAYKREDLVTIRPGKDSGWLDTCVESLLRRVPVKHIQVRLFSLEYLLPD